MPSQTTAPAKPVSTPRRTRVVMWLAMAAVVLMLACAVFVSARIAALSFGGVLLVLGFVRAVSRAPGPYGISTRSRGFDVTVLLLAGAVMMALTVIAPMESLS